MRWYDCTAENLWKRWFKKLPYKNPLPEKTEVTLPPHVLCYIEEIKIPEQEKNKNSIVLEFSYDFEENK